jgi:hypothetical protein
MIALHRVMTEAKAEALLATAKSGMKRAKSLA